jgi:hypothetical protein
VAGVTQDQVDAAYNAFQAAQQQLAAAQAELQAAKPYTPAFETAKTKVDAAKTNVSNARQELNRVSAGYRKDNPDAKPAGQTEKDKEELARQRAKNAADPTYGIPDTDKERADRRERLAPKPAAAPRNDSPVQVQTANTAAAAQAETARNNQVRAAQDASDAKREALVQAGTLFTGIRGQVSREAEAEAKNNQENITTIRGAATTLVTAATTARGQDIDAQKVRSAFVQDVLTTAMPQVLQLMLKTPKGSQVANNFLKAFLAMAGEAWERAQLGNLPPPLGPDTPGFNTLMQLQGYRLPQELPTMPRSNQVDQRTAQSMAVGGMPLPGDQGAIGVPRLAYPQVGETPRTGAQGNRNGDGIDPIAEAAQSEEGQAIRTALKGEVADIEAKLERKEPLTPQEQQRLDAAKAVYNQEIKELATRRQATAAQNSRGGADKEQELKNDVRATLISGDPNQKLKTMALATTALENQQQGKTLSPAEQAILSTLDPEDLQIIRQNMTPEVSAILQKHQRGEQVTDQERQLVQSAVVGTTEGIKSRPVTAPVTSAPPVLTEEEKRAQQTQPTGTTTVTAPQPGASPTVTTPAVTQPAGLPEGAPPMEPTAPGEKGQVLIKRPDGSMYWQNVDYVQSTDNVIYDPKKQSSMPTPLSGPSDIQAKKFSYSPPDMSDPDGVGTMFSGASDERGVTQMPTEIPLLFGPRSQPEEMMYRSMPEPEPIEFSQPEPEPMPQLFDPFSFYNRNDEEDEEDSNYASSYSGWDGWA